VFGRKAEQTADIWQTSAQLTYPHLNGTSLHQTVLIFPSFRLNDSFDPGKHARYFNKV
jgi:hypothetical protein